MDPRWRSPTSNFARFPRPRGDGPKPWVDLASWLRVSPPTRGWTREEETIVDDLRGFPAHAGMDPVQAGDYANRHWFPRPRGDGPADLVYSPFTSQVSPPTRGWTRSRQSRNDADVGFPAHAGMDPPGIAALRRRARFPRPRGDGPSKDGSRTYANVVSPPTRGWTFGAPSWEIWAKGFPAHAGMDPRNLRPSQVVQRFPRPRGDRPEIMADFFESAPVSPPTRGWTPSWISELSGSRGFPAHAGMDLFGSRSNSGVHRFPRPRGDVATGH